MKLILNNIEYDHFETVVPLNSFEARHAVDGRKYKGTILVRRSEELASVTVFMDSKKTTVLNEWCFEKENLEMNDEITIIKDAILIEPAPRIGGSLT